uniref:DUF202 domain-containing protein n=1 Tax=Odontella aurita TaxID=265563 RepID=A0A7S4N375_9STRA|mmetsp:Transcript_45323/g.138033  ORF Transcript_45323/g.138033 Transcript_45323/m.138033 type:complete len:220 (+) Transcript_45323:159-818(+)
MSSPGKSSPGKSSPGSYYFIRKRSSSRSSDGEASFGYNKPPSFDEDEVVRKEKDESIDVLPEGATTEEFSSRPVMSAIREVDEGDPASGPVEELADGDAAVGTLLLERRVPVKVEAKVYFANERTFLAWLHSAVWLFGGAATIIQFADFNPYSQMYGIILLPVAIAFTVYAIYRHHIRVKMIKIKHPGPYEDLVGPTVLGVILMCSIVAQFALQMYAMW